MSLPGECSARSSSVGNSQLSTGNRFRGVFPVADSLASDIAADTIDRDASRELDPEEEEVDSSD